MAKPAYVTDQDAVLKNVPSDIKWRGAVPNYTKAKELFEKYKSTNHKAGSLEDIVQNLVKNWEKEVSHKTDPRQWDTVDLDNYKFSCNGLQKYTGLEMVKKGTYNALLGDSIYYDATKTTFEDSHDAFRKTLGEGFAWEVLEVFSGPPNVTFSWRHFGKMTDKFKCTGLMGIPYKVKPTNKLLELYGMCKATVNDELKIQDLQVYYDPNQLFVQLLEKCPYAPFGKMQPTPATDGSATRKVPVSSAKYQPPPSQAKHQSHAKHQPYAAHQQYATYQAPSQHAIHQQYGAYQPHATHQQYTTYLPPTSHGAYQQYGTYQPHATHQQYTTYLPPPPPREYQTAPSPDNYYHHHHHHRHHNHSSSKCPAHRH